MKNTKKIKVTVCPQAPYSDGGDSVSVKNMRPDAARGCLSPVGTFQQSATINGVPLLVMDKPGGNCIFSYNDHRLWVSYGAGSLAVADVGSCPLAAMADGDTAVFMISGRAPLRLKYISTNEGIPEWRDISSSGTLPEVGFVCKEKHTLSAATDPFLLDGDYVHWNGPLSDKDKDVVTRSFTSVYEHIADQAGRRGLFTQPVMIWWRMLDEKGRVVHKSLPVLLSSSGVQGMDRVEAVVEQQGGRFKKVRPVLLKVDAFLPAVKITRPSSMAWTVEVLITPPVETVMMEKGEASFMFNGSTAVEASLLIGLPQVMDCRRMAGLMLDRLEAVSQVALRIPASEATAEPVIIPHVGIKGVKAVQNKLVSTVGKPVSKESGLIMECSVPHSFSAGAVALAGDMALWGNVSPVHCMPGGVASLATETDSATAWAGAVCAEISDGEVLGDTSSGLDNAPVALSALIAYPLASCEAVTVQVSSALTQGRRSNKFKLSPTPGGRWAIYVSEGLKPILPAEWEVSETAIQAMCVRPEMTYEATVVAAPVVNPLAVECDINIGEGKVVAITPASRTQSAWDFARRHLYVFTTVGIYSLAVNSARTLCSAHLIHPVGVVNACKVAVAPQGVFAATTSGQLVCVAGSAAKEIRRYMDCRYLGWSSAYGGELWCGLADGGTMLICPGNRLVELSDLNIAYMIGASGGKLWLVGADGGLSEAGSQATNGFTDVLWRHSVALPAFADTGMRLAHVDWDFSSSMASGRLIIRGHNGNAGRSGILAGFKINGNVAAPVRYRVPLCAPYRYVTAEFAATVTNDTRLGPLTMTFTKQ
ncbi:hypothetical protein [uncultured Muribaculum sp.]|uniref:hypothetical protein n=1 Tax=uncultured Muribaculum sp. TaxID=1918613 RepID=UPI0025884754|nr:hypothetical protein [uncultured Muribaculum sp.]